MFDNQISFEVKNDFSYIKFNHDEWEKALNYFLYLNKHDDLKDYILYVYHGENIIKKINWDDVPNVRFTTERGFLKVQTFFLSDLDVLLKDA